LSRGNLTELFFFFNKFQTAAMSVGKLYWFYNDGYIFSINLSCHWIRFRVKCTLLCLIYHTYRMIGLGIWLSSSKSIGQYNGWNTDEIIPTRLAKNFLRTYREMISNKIFSYYLLITFDFLIDFTRRWSLIDKTGIFDIIILYIRR